MWQKENFCHGEHEKFKEKKSYPESVVGSYSVCIIPYIPVPDKEPQLSEYREQQGWAGHQTYWCLRYCQMMSSHINRYVG